MDISLSLSIVCLSIGFVGSAYEMWNPYAKEVKSDLVVRDNFPINDFKKNLHITGLTEEEKKTILDLHNAYRSLVRPPSADMIEVTWDDNISAIAQDFANDCTVKSRSGISLGPWVDMGENICWWFSGTYHEGKFVKHWWDQVRHYDVRNKTCLEDKDCNGYTQLVRAKTERVGCGVARCQGLKNLPGFGKLGTYFFVCTYSGRFHNTGNTTPYTVSDVPCSACNETGYPQCRYNLCVTQQMIDQGVGYDGKTRLTGLSRIVIPDKNENLPDSMTRDENNPTLRRATTEPMAAFAKDGGALGPSSSHSFLLLTLTASFFLCGFVV